MSEVLTFCSTPFSVELLHVAAPTGECAPLPATAAGHVGWGGLTNVLLYRTADCTGQATSTLRTYDAGRFTSFVAY